MLRQQKIFLVFHQVDRELTDVQPINFTVNKLDQFTDTIDYHFKNRTHFNYDDDSSCQPPGLVEADSTLSFAFLLGMLPSAQHMNALKWRLRNPVTTTMDPRLFAKT
jgi:hypothetical protein